MHQQIFHSICNTKVVLFPRHSSFCARCCVKKTQWIHVSIVRYNIYDIMYQNRGVILKITKISKSFQVSNQPTKQALNNISLSFPSTGNIFIVGKSGSGKSTLLNIIGGMDRPSSGSILLGDRELTTCSDHTLNAYRNDIIGFIFQDYNLIESLSVYQNLFIAISMKSFPHPKRITEALASVGLQGFESRMPSTLSGGERQRVAIARALLKKPHILLADEPTGALDTETSKEIFELLKHISKSILVITVSHDRESAKTYADRVIEMKDGNIIYDSMPEMTPEHVFHSFRDPQLRISQSFLLGIKNIGKLSVRLVLSLIISTTLLLILGLSDAASSYDQTTQIYQSMSGSTSPWIHINQKMKMSESEDRMMLISEQVVLDHQERKNHFFPVHIGFERGIQDYLFDPILSTDLYPSMFSGAMAMDEIQLSRLDVSLVSGHLPTAVNHIVITKRIYDHFKTFGLNQDGVRLSIQSFQDILGFPIDFGLMGTFTITGVVDTRFDLVKYEKLLTPTKINPLLQTILSQELSAVNGSIHEMVFISPLLSTHMIDRLNLEYVYPAEYVGAVELKTPFSTQTNNIAKIQSGDSEPIDIKWINGHTELSDHHILLNYDYVRSFINIISLLQRSDQLIDQFVVNHYGEIQHLFEAEQTISYQEYIKTAESNHYHPGKEYAHFIDQSFISLVEEGLLANSFARLNFVNHRSYYDLIIAGVFMSDDAMDFDTVIVSPNFYQSLIENEQIFPYHSMITMMGSSMFHNKALIWDLTHPEGDLYWVGRNDILSNVSYLGSLFEGISIVLGFVTLGVGCLTLMILFTFIYSSIQNRQKDIGILRSMGAGFKHIYAWFAAESLMIFAIGACIAGLLLSVFSYIINQVVSTQASINVRLIVTGPRQYVLILLVSLLVSCGSALIPVMIYVRKNPMDSIRLS